ncbi:MAG: hypothetical protein IKN75_02115 [Prevotella sp.]|nr:hypothetical protein [Prevotella sp.]
MKQEKVKNMTVLLESEEGENIVDGCRMVGTAVLDREEGTFKFSKSPKKVKQNPKNTIIFGGEHMNCRLHTSTGAFRITVQLPAMVNIAEIRGQLISEFTESLAVIENK